MSAVITATGTWTPLNFDPVGLPVSPANEPGQTTFPTTSGFSTKTGMNVKDVFFMQFEQLKNRDLPELTQFIQAAADGYGIGYQAALSLLYHCFKAAQLRQSPTVSGQAGLYTP